MSLGIAIIINYKEKRSKILPMQGSQLPKMCIALCHLSQSIF